MRRTVHRRKSKTDGILSDANVKVTEVLSAGRLNPAEGIDSLPMYDFTGETDSKSDEASDCERDPHGKILLPSDVISSEQAQTAFLQQLLLQLTDSDAKYFA